MSRTSRNKGRAFEQWVARQLREAVGDASIRRTYGQSRKGHDAPDVAAPWLWLECQHAAPAAWNPEKKFAQAVEAVQRAKSPHPPVAVCRLSGGRGPWAITVQMWLETLDMLRGRAADPTCLHDVARIPWEQFVTLYACYHLSRTGQRPID